MNAMMQTSFVPGWAVSLPLLLLAAIVLWWALFGHEDDNDNDQEGDYRGADRD